MKTQPLYLSLATLLMRQRNLQAHGALANPTQRTALDAVNEELDRLIKEHLPSGSGFDRGTRLRQGEDLFVSPRLVLLTDFHHMNDMGTYTEWTEHTVYATAGFQGLLIRVTGRNVNGIKDYIGDTFHEALTAEVKAWPDIMKPGERPEPKPEPPLVLNACPVCGAADIIGYSLNVDGKHASQQCDCSACDASWTDIYTLTKQEVDE